MHRPTGRKWRRNHLKRLNWRKSKMARMSGVEATKTKRAGVGKIVLASLVSATIEFYDFYIFGTAAALVFGAIFFPKSAPETQTLNAHLSCGIAFLAWPVGSFLFGHFGDRVGRPRAPAKSAAFSASPAPALA
jgi:MFS family permease